MLPAELLATQDGEVARVLYARLLEQGAIVCLQQDAGNATCALHPAQLLGRTCKGCGVLICAVCRLDAGGKRFCKDCVAKEGERARLGRVRKLFLLFLFSVFCYEAIGWWRAEQARLDPSTVITVGVYQLVPPDQDDAALLRLLNDPDGVWSLTRIEQWYASEYERYTGREHDTVRLRIFGPWREQVNPPSLGDEGVSWWKVAWRAYEYPRYFHAIARRHGEEPDDVDARVYVVYGRSEGDLAAHSRGSSKGRVAVAFVNLGDPNPAYAQVTVAHELAHILGAEDLYDPDTFLPIYPEGYAEPHREPRFPQRYAEVMAVDRPIDTEHELEVRSLEEVRVGYRSAALMRWISLEQAELLYRTPR
jgi:hypothetical protein